MKHFRTIEDYRNQPFKVRYTKSDIERKKDGFKTKDGLFETYKDKAYIYWRGEKCYPDIAYGYLFSSSTLEEAAINLNKSLDNEYDFNPEGIGQRFFN